MKTKFFLCMRPPVIETDDGDNIKLPPTVGSSYSTVSGNTSGRRNRDLQQRKRVAAERYIGPVSVKSNNKSFNGNISEGKSEVPFEKDPQKAQKTTCSVSLKTLSTISNGEVSGGPRSNLGVYLMISSLFFTMFWGKFFGILCTLILLYSLYPHRKGNGSDGLRSINMVANSAGKGSPEVHKKRVIMAALLERKSHNRESIKFFS